MFPVVRTDAVSKWARLAIQNANRPVQRPVKLIFAKVVDKFADLGCGVYAEMGPGGPDYGRIWVRKTETDPRTGQKRDVLVVRTNDDDEIVREVTASLKSESLLFVQRGDWLKNEGTGQIGIVRSVNPETEVIRIVLNDGTGKTIQPQDHTQWRKTESPKYSRFQVVAIDPADQVKPMSWTTNESKHEDDQTGGVPHLNQQDPGRQNPAGQEPNVLYNTEDANAGGQDNGDYLVHVQPKQNQVVVKFNPQGGPETPLMENLLSGADNPENSSSAMPNAQQPQQGQQQQQPTRKNFEDLKIPVEY